MATIGESAVFEYCQKIFRELDIQDGGYYPSKHDKAAFEKTAVHFSISESEVGRIFTAYNQQAADLEMKKINKLPPILRKKVIEQRGRDILLNNKDLPFFKSEGAPTEELADALDILSAEYKIMIETIAHAGWTIPLDIDVKQFNELEIIAYDDIELDNYFTKYYSDKKLRQISRKISKVFEGTAQQTIFNECVEAYMNNMFSICLTTLISVLEGFISIFGDDPKDVRIMRICKFHADEEMNKKNNIKSLCWLSMYEYARELYKPSDFSQPEPNTVNRHWIHHGRTGRIAEKTDCIRIFNALSTMVVVKQIQKKLV